MTESNRLRMTWVDEVTPGVPPTTPRMRTVRLTGETLVFKPTFTTSEEIRSDRMNSDPIKTGETNSGPVNTEFSFPVDQTPHSSWLASAFCSPWANTPFRDNDGTPGAAISGITASSGVIAVASGPAFVIGHLARLTGFGVAGNNGLFRIITGSATVPAVGASTLTDEASPPASARVKVVGFQGAAGDVAAVSDGLTSTALNFTTLGLAVGMWIKVGGTGGAFRFATEGCNGYARVIAISANKLTLDNLPSAPVWTADNGAGKTIRVFFGDQLRNGTTKRFGTIERGFMGQATPTYVKQSGMMVDQFQINLESGAVVKATYTFKGLNGASDNTTLDSTPDAATTNGVMSAAVHVGRISDGGSAVTGPNFNKSLQINLNNNAREVMAIRSDGKVGPVDINLGECSVQVQANTYFGSGNTYADYLAGIPTSASSIIAKDGQALVFAIPRMTRTDGSPNASGKNQDVMLPLTAQASFDPLVGAHITLDRLEYVEA